MKNHAIKGQFSNYNGNVEFIRIQGVSLNSYLYEIFRTKIVGGSLDGDAALCNKCWAVVTAPAKVVMAPDLVLTASSAV